MSVGIELNVMSDDFYFFWFGVGVGGVFVVVLIIGVIFVKMVKIEKV